MRNRRLTSRLVVDFCKKLDVDGAQRAECNGRIRLALADSVQFLLSKKCKKR